AYRIFSTLVFASFAVLAVLYWLGAITGWPWVWAASSPAALFAVGLVAMCLEAEMSPFTPGANDNATAAALVLTLAEEFKRQPLERTRVWLLCSGCEEALHEGAQTFFRRHRGELRRPRAIAFEMMGCSGPGWLTREGILLPLRADPELEAMAAGVAASHPELGAYPVRLAGGVTEAADARAAGIPAMALMGLTRQGKAPYWHLPTDTVDKLDDEVMERAYRFTRELIRAIDQRPRGN
ncbi:MAG TPA: M28 family peptidase, partial [Bacillota bacterium]|nr:M28 family peptidase [Bacillota bacterium]